jgi:hypothetical protein
MQKPSLASSSVEAKEGEQEIAKGGYRHKSTLQRAGK